MPDRPSLLRRVRAALEGQVPAETLQAYRRAGLGVYKLLEAAEAQRLAARIEGQDPWTIPPATQAELVCAWNAFALQTLGDQLLAAEERISESTRGYVSRVTAEQALAFYHPVEGWLRRAAQARSTPTYRLDVPLPAALPPWRPVEPCPPAHFEGMLAANGALRKHAEVAVAAFETLNLPPEHEPTRQWLRQLLAEATAAADYAASLWASNPPRTLHQQVERQAQEAIALFFRLGQLLAMPALAEPPERPAFPGAAFVAMPPPWDLPALVEPTSTPLPARPAAPDDDPWCLTDPGARPLLAQDPAACRAIATLWTQDPDPARTRAIQAQIDAAVARGDVAYARDPAGARLGPYYCCPWAPIYVVQRPVTLGGQPLRTFDRFTFDVSAEDTAAGGGFRRRILVGAFQPAGEVDYCLPDAATHHR